jgi:hypothetical protein
MTRKFLTSNSKTSSPLSRKSKLRRRPTVDPGQSPDLASEGRPSEGRQGREKVPASEVLTSLVDTALAEEAARKESYERRGLAVVTTSGTLVTVILAIAGLHHSAPTPLTVGLLAAALVSFVGAAAGGLLANLPQGYKQISTESIATLLDKTVFFGDVNRVSRKIVLARFGELTAARRANARKARALRWGLFSELLAVLLLSFASVAAALR